MGKRIYIQTGVFNTKLDAAAARFEGIDAETAPVGPAPEV